MRNLILLFSILLSFGLSAQTFNDNALVNYQNGNDYARVTGLQLKTYIGAGAGSVTSVGATVPAFMTVTGVPITTTGTMAFSFNSQAANLVFASPDGSAGVPGFIALGVNHIPTLPASKVTGAAITAGSARVGITGAITGLTGGTIDVNEGSLILNNIGGTLATNKGGTGLSSVGAAGTVLNSNGTTNQYTALAFTSNAAANGWTGLSLNLALASATLTGLVSTASQTFAGNKIFQGNLVSSQYFEAIGSSSAPAANFRGGINAAPSVYTASATLDANNYNVSIGTLTSTITITLPQCNNILNAGAGRMITITKTGADAFGVIIDPEAAQTFTDGAPNKTVYGVNNAVTCICNGTGASAGTWNIFQ